VTLDINAEKARRALRPCRVLHPLLLSLCPLLGLFAFNAGRIPAAALARPAIVILVTAGMLWLVLRVTLRDRLRAGLATSLIIFAFLILWGVLEDVILAIVPMLDEWPRWVFYFVYTLVVLVGLFTAAVWVYREQHRFPTVLVASLAGLAVVWFIIAWFLLSPVFGRRAAWLISGYLIAFVTALVGVLRYQGNTETATRNMNRFAGILAILYLAMFLFNVQIGSIPSTPSLEAKPTKQPPETGWPDIYLIVMEGYPRSDVLAGGFGHDNRPFEEQLAVQGFVFAAQSTANYPTTTLSLAACLNLDYLHNLLPESAVRSGDPKVAGSLYHNNRAIQFLHDQGYHVIAFSPGLELREPRSPVDECRTPPWTLTELEATLLAKTVLSRALQVVCYFRYDNPAYWRFALRRKRILFAADELVRIAAEPSDRPRFIYADLLIPEPPFLFTRDGGRAQPFGPGSLAIDRRFRGSPQEFRQHYIDQVCFTNELLARTTERIAKQAKRPSVVLVVSGSGPEMAVRRSPEGEETPAPARFANLVAARFPETSTDPDEPGKALYDSISLVNLFRVTLNRLFNLDLPLLPDRLLLGIDGTPYSMGSTTTE